MKTRHEIVVELLEEKLEEAKVGIIVSGIDEISPVDITKEIASNKGHKIYTVCINYGDLAEKDTEEYCISGKIESAVVWRNNAECAGKILVFVRGDVDRMHSLGVFDNLTKADVTAFAVELQIRSVANANRPVQEFWNAIKDTVGNYTLQNIEEYISAVESETDKTKAISRNLWMLNLLCDEEILSASINKRERLLDNKSRIIELAQISENGRKNLSKSLARATGTQKAELRKTYRLVEQYSQYGERELLKELDYSLVVRLLTAAKPKTPKPGPNPGPIPGPNPGPAQGGNNQGGTDEPATPTKTLKKKDIDNLVSDYLLFGDEEDSAVEELSTALSEGYADETQRKITVSPVGGVFEDNPIEIDKPNTSDSLRKLVGMMCSESVWGGVIEVKETSLKDAIASSATPHEFSPDTICYGQENRTLRDVLQDFDTRFPNFEYAFSELLDTIITERKKLVKHIDMLMYHPLVLLSADKEARETLNKYIGTWTKLYALYNAHQEEMAEVGSSATSFIGRALIALDVVYFHTGDDKWKGILMPLHPFYLWGYYQVFETLSERDTLKKSELVDLRTVLLSPPQMLNYLAVDAGITHSSDIILPCSGSIQMLPTYENSTNRYIGDDGLESIPDVLDRWLNYAPFSKHELRICTVDAPNLASVVKMVSAFADKYSVERIIYDVFYTRGQNGNTELASLDYADKDYQIGEYIKNGRLVLCVHDVKATKEIKDCLEKHPVHVAFFFDQSKYELTEKPDVGRLYCNPFVVTYDFRYESMDHMGSLSPSSRSQTGIVGDYHSLMVTTGFLKEQTSPWLCVNPHDDMDYILSSVREKRAQWLVIADRDIGNYQIGDEHELIPIGEKLYERRRVGIWASKHSRIIDQYRKDLMDYNLTPDENTLVDMIRNYGHIAATGLISIPKVSFDPNTTRYRQKGLLGTLFAATWFAKREAVGSDSVLVASLDTDKARTWLTARDEEDEDTDKKLKQERADLIGMRYDKSTDTLFLQPIEVKTRDEGSEAQRDYDLYYDEYGQSKLRGHAPNQVASIIKILKSVFEGDDNTPGNFIAARREVLKYQIVTECFRNIHDKQWQEEWHGVLARAFEKEDRGGLKIVISGILVYVRLGDSTTHDSELVSCIHDGEEAYPIDLAVLTSYDIQKQIFNGDITASSQTESQGEFDADVSSSIENVQDEVSAVSEVSEANNDSAQETDDVPSSTGAKEPISPVTEFESDVIETSTEDDVVDELSATVDKTVAEEVTVSPKPVNEVRLLLGVDQRSKEPFYWEFGNKKLSNRHLLINGNSGSGKTYCIEALLMEAVLQGVSAVIFDYTGGFTPKQLEPKFVAALDGRIQQRFVRKDKIPVNPFKHYENVVIDVDTILPETDIDVAGRIAQTVASVYSLGDQQRNAVYTAALKGLKTYGELMNFKHLADEIEALNTSYAKTALSRLQQFVDIDPFTTDDGFDWGDIRDSGGTVYVYQFAGYGRDIQVMLTDLLLWDLWSFGVKSGSEDKPFIYVIDEAQNLSHSEKSPSGMLLTEGRKYGLSGWYATQFMKPQLDDDEIQRLQQADQKLYFCPPGEGVVPVAKNIDITTSGTKEWSERLQKLNKGECVTCGSTIRGGKWDKYYPRVIKISSFEDRIKK